MRLIIAESIRTPRLETIEFYGEPEPYAILSHTWSDDEVILTDLVNGTAAQRGAYQKVRFACEQAMSDGLTYVWIDTCCIDKTSSSELSEAINSMFAWYRRASTCYVYLNDLFNGVDSLGACRWFTRGFTLQELIAPARITFYAGSDWVHIGDKGSLSRDLARITNISEDILLGERPFETTSIAGRMGWAARRQTTRAEDIAYCLMGIFDVNMPLLYGEGGVKAFRRLQEEIMKQTRDHSLFAWQDEDAPDDMECGLLAPSPRCFESTREIVPYQPWEKRLPHAVTNEGLSIDILVLASTQDNSRTTASTSATPAQPPRHTPDQDALGRAVFHGVLDCPTPDFVSGRFTTVYLVETEGGGEHYARIRASQMGSVGLDQVQHQTTEASAVTTKTARRRRQIYVAASPAVRLPDVAKVYPWHYLSLDGFPPSRDYALLEAVALRYVQEARSGQQRPQVSKMHRSEPYFPPYRNLKQQIGLALGKMQVVRRPGAVTLAMLFQRRVDSRHVLLLVGSLDAVRLGFSVHEMQEGAEEGEGGGGDAQLMQWSGSKLKMPTPAGMNRLFTPTPLGHTVRMPHGQVTVSATTSIETMAKVYNLTIDMQALDPPLPVLPAKTSMSDQGSETSKSRLRRLFS